MGIWLPAVEDNERLVYFVKDREIVGQGRIVTRYGERLTIMPDEATQNGFFADDYAIPIMGDVANLRYNSNDGYPMSGFVDEPADRHKGTRIVGKMLFDYGIGCTEFDNVAGWGAALTQEDA